MLGHLGAILGLCWAILGHPGAILGLCWAILGRSWGHLGAKCRFLSKSTKHRKLRYITWSAAGAGSRIAKAGGFCRLSPTALEKEEAAQNGKRIPKAKAPLGRATHGWPLLIDFLGRSLCYVHWTCFMGIKSGGQCGALCKKRSPKFSRG